MANSITTNFAGTFDDRILTRVITGFEAMNKGLLYPRLVEDKENIQRLTLDNIIQDRAATPTASGTPTYTERILAPQDYMIYFEFNPRDFEHHWYEYAMNGELVFRELPEPVRMVLLDEVLKVHDNYLGTAVWKNRKTATAEAAPYNKFDGFKYLLNADANTVKIASPVALTAANILSKLQAVYAATPQAVLDSPNYKIAISSADHEFYGDALVALTNKSISPENGIPTVYRGKELVRLVGMPKDTIIAGNFSNDFQSNFRIGVSRGNNMETVQMEKLQANSELHFCKMLLKVGVQVGFTEEVVIYSA
jgi:hypothetical protein